MEVNDLNLPQYMFIEKEIREMKYGLMQLTIKVENGFICDVVIHKAKRSLFKRTVNGAVEGTEHKIDLNQEKIDFSREKK